MEGALPSAHVDTCGCSSEETDRSFVSGTTSSSSTPNVLRWKRPRLADIASSCVGVQCCSQTSGVSDRSVISGTTSASTPPNVTRWRRCRLSEIAATITGDAEEGGYHEKVDKVIACGVCYRMHASCESCPCGPKALPPNHGHFRTSMKLMRSRKTRKIKRRMSAAEVESEKCQQSLEEAMLNNMTVKQRLEWRESDSCPVRMAIRFPGGRHRPGDMVSSDEYICSDEGSQHSDK